MYLLKRNSSYSAPRYSQDGSSKIKNTKTMAHQIPTAFSSKYAGYKVETLFDFPSVLEAYSSNRRNIFADYFISCKSLRNDTHMAYSFYVVHICHMVQNRLPLKKGKSVIPLLWIAQTRMWEHSVPGITREGICSYRYTYWIAIFWIVSYSILGFQLRQARIEI